MVVLSLIACASASDPPPDAMNADIWFGLTPLSELALHGQYTVSAYELIANGEKYIDKYVQTSGYLYQEKPGTKYAEMPFLYPDKTSLRHRVRKNSIIILDLIPGCSGEIFEQLSSKFVTLNGVYRGERLGNPVIFPVDYVVLSEFDDETGELLPKTEERVYCRDLSVRDLSLRDKED